MLFDFLHHESSLSLEEQKLYSVPFCSCHICEQMEKAYSVGISKERIEYIRDLRKQRHNAGKAPICKVAS